MRPRFRSVLFDFDGVLIDSEPLMRHAFAVAYRRVGGTGRPPVEGFLSRNGGALPQILAALGLPSEMAAHFREVSMRRLDLVRVFPGMRELLAEAAAVPVALGLVTGKDSERTAQMLAHFSLDRYFDAVVCSDMVTRPKPHPDSVHLAMRQLGASLEDTVLVGDAPNDIRAASQAAVRSIAVTWGIATHEQLLKAGPDCVVNDPQELRRVLLPPPVESRPPEVRNVHPH